MKPAVPASALPDVGTSSRRAYWMMLRRIAVFAACVDMMYLVVFWLLDMPGLALINIVSACMYIAAYHLIGRRINLPAVLLMWTEVLFHSALCTLLLGWNSGIHYFLLVFLPAVAVSTSLRQSIVTMGLLLFCYISLDTASQLIPAAYALSPTTETGMRWLSITVVFIMFGYAGRYYAMVVADAERNLRRMATIDPLSGLWNRRHVLEMAQREMANARRQGQPLSIVMGDIDHFKAVNDTYGHDGGDRVIQHVAAIFQTRLRCSDVTGRWGGEEILILLPATDAHGASLLFDDVRSYLERTPCMHNGQPIHITMSFGICEMEPHHGIEDTVKSADVALYDAKHGGRNRVVVAAPPLPTLEAADTAH